MHSEVNAKPLAVEIRTCAQHRRAGARLARDIGERIRRIGQHEKYRVGLRPHDPRDDIAIDRGVFVEQLEAALRVAAIRSAAGFFVHAHSDQHDARALEVVVIAVHDIDLGTERRAVAHVGRHRLGGLAAAIEQNDFAGAAAIDGGHGAGAAHIAGSNNANLHELIRLLARFIPASEPLTLLLRGSPRTGTRYDARPRRSSSRSSWRWPRRRASRKSRGPRASSRPAACYRRAAPQAYPTA